MHELSIALSILDVASEKSAAWDETPCAIHLKLGPLSGVVKEALVSAFRLAAEGTDWEQTELVINDAPLVGWCRAATANARSRRSRSSFARSVVNR